MSIKLDTITTMSQERISPSDQEEYIEKKVIKIPESVQNIMDFLDADFKKENISDTLKDKILPSLIEKILNGEKVKSGVHKDKLVGEKKLKELDFPPTLIKKIIETAQEYEESTEKVKSSKGKEVPLTAVQSPTRNIPQVEKKDVYTTEGAEVDEEQIEKEWKEKKKEIQLAYQKSRTGKAIFKKTLEAFDEALRKENPEDKNRIISPRIWNEEGVGMIRIGKMPKWWWQKVTLEKDNGEIILIKKSMLKENIKTGVYTTSKPEKSVQKEKKGGTPEEKKNRLDSITIEELKKPLTRGVQFQDKNQKVIFTIHDLYEKDGINYIEVINEEKKLKETPTKGKFKNAIIIGDYEFHSNQLSEEFLKKIETSKKTEKPVAQKESKDKKETIPPKIWNKKGMGMKIIGGTKGYRLTLKKDNGEEVFIEKPVYLENIKTGIYSTSKPKE